MICRGWTRGIQRTGPLCIKSKGRARPRIWKLLEGLGIDGSLSKMEYPQDGTIRPALIPMTDRLEQR